jgi:hypothetical protein
VSAVIAGFAHTHRVLCILAEKDALPHASLI